MFQPGEEGPGGAQRMLDEGMFETIGSTPDSAYAIHVAPGVPAHIRQSPRHRHGRSQYAARDDVTAKVDTAPAPRTPPIPSSSRSLEFGQALYSMITGSFSVFDPIVAEVTQLEAGTAINIIPATAKLGASVGHHVGRDDEEVPCQPRLAWQSRSPPHTNTHRRGGVDRAVPRDGQ